MSGHHLQRETQPAGAKARPESGTVSERIDAIAREYEQEQQRAATTTVEEDLAALARIREHREEILVRRGGVPIDWDFVAEINRMREERDAEILASLNDDGD